jgi:hypothetical protein
MISYFPLKVLQKRDDASCLQRLLKYPPVENVVSILSMAWKYLERLKNIDEEEVNPKSTNPVFDPKNKKEPIFFNSGLVYKPPMGGSNQKVERKFEEKSENYPTIMENQNKTLLLDYDKKVPLFSHQHERPKSTNTQQKKEVNDIINYNIDNDNTNPEETNNNNNNIKRTEPIFKDLDEKIQIKNESPKKIVDFNKGYHKEKEIISEKTTPTILTNIPSTINNTNSLKLESLKERLNFINGQCQDVIHHLDLEQSKFY